MFRISRTSKRFWVRPFSAEVAVWEQATRGINSVRTLSEVGLYSTKTSGKRLHEWRIRNNRAAIFCLLCALFENGCACVKIQMKLL